MATTTANLGLTKPDYTEKADIAVINGNMDKIDTAVHQRDRAVDLTDNGYFANPINQRGASSYNSEGYTIDRWRLNGALPMTIDNGCITFSNNTSGTLYLEHRIPLGKLTIGEMYTVAVKTTDGTIHCGSCKLSDTLTSTVSTDDFYVQIHKGSDCGRLQLRIRGGKTVQVVWVAMYEGAYTAETLPAYMPKGYAAELLECQRYYYNIPDNSDISYIGYSGSATQARITIPLPVPMIAKPTISVEDLTKTNIFTETASLKATAVSCNNAEGNVATLYCTTSGLTAWKPCVMRFNTPAALSADL